MSIASADKAIPAISPLMGIGGAGGVRPDVGSSGNGSPAPDGARGFTPGGPGSNAADGSQQGKQGGNGNGAAGRSGGAPGSDDNLSQDEERQVRKLQQRDQEVRRHERAHMAAGGPYAGSPSYETVRGPDGEQYAVSGSVDIDTSKESDPQATIEKMETVKRAALAPANPSSQDRQIAAEAEQKRLQAQQELNEQRGAAGAPGPGAESQIRAQEAGNGFSPGAPGASGDGPQAGGSSASPDTSRTAALAYRGGPAPDTSAMSSHGASCNCDACCGNTAMQAKLMGSGEAAAKRA